MHLFFIFAKSILITRWKILWNHEAKHGLVIHHLLFPDFSFSFPLYQVSVLQIQK